MLKTNCLLLLSPNIAPQGSVGTLPYTLDGVRSRCNLQVRLTSSNVYGHFTCLLSCLRSTKEPERKDLSVPELQYQIQPMDNGGTTCEKKPRRVTWTGIRPIELN